MVQMKFHVLMDEEDVSPHINCVCLNWVIREIYCTVPVELTSRSVKKWNAITCSNVQTIIASPSGKTRGLP